MLLDCAMSFTGAPMDPVIPGYILGNGYRAYLPSLMRFNAPDSASPFDAGGPNSYTYCNGDPIDRVDPSGHTNIDLGELDALQGVMTDSFTRHASDVRTPDISPGGIDSPLAAARAIDNMAPSRSAPLVRSRSNSTPNRSSPSPLLPGIGAPPAATSIDIADADSVPDWRREVSAPADKDRRLRIEKARALLNDPPAYSIEPTSKAVPLDYRRLKGYDITVTLRWAAVTEELAPMEVFAHVHYAWDGNTWGKIAGHAWIPGVHAWEAMTTRRVLRMAPRIPPPPSRAAW